ncbi:MAG: 1-acyl-sn-glycerol-3-phosphate acyltransferase [Oscillospiraceae bacterium]
MWRPSGPGYPLRIMAKKQLLKIPHSGHILQNMGVFAVDRGNSDIQAVKTAIQSLKQGWNLLIFPEGTRVKDPGHAEVKGGAAMMAIRSGVDMVPMFIDTEKAPVPSGAHHHRPALYPGVHRAKGHGGGIPGQRRRDHAAGLCIGRDRMPVIQAKSAGFCYGVRRAVELAEKTARESGGCVMLGSIIHNANVVARLEQLGARQVDSPDEVRPGTR